MRPCLNNLITPLKKKCREVFSYICKSIYTYTHICLYTQQKHIHSYTYTYMHVYKSKFIYVYIILFLYTHVCFLYTHIYFIYICVYICTHMLLVFPTCEVCFCVRLIARVLQKLGLGCFATPWSMTPDQPYRHPHTILWNPSQISHYSKINLQSNIHSFIKMELAMKAFLLFFYFAHCFLSLVALR